jgi:GxxExxY protein
MNQNNLLIQELTSISLDIYNSLGPGYNEVVYHRAFEVALRLKNISYQSELVTPIFYKGHNIGHGRVDILVNNNFIIELKAISNFGNDTANIQIKNYMKHYTIKDGLVVNFGQPTKNSPGGLNIKYIYTDNNITRIFNFINGTFVEINPVNEMSIS